ncbi:MAG: AraC family transcriptional regulator [Gammaproteobacteria bacterium]|nr:AraC family transcriptional regulator [Gammaproteobacteria bacterium]NNK98538.1 helix-turn-helix domain-containing protein [Xanthomonadales bacterium]
MTDYLTDIPSRQQEEGRIVANWLRRIRDVLREGPPHLFVRALEHAGLNPADVDSTQNLSQDHLDVVSEFIREQIPDLTLRMLKSSDLLDLGLMGYAALSAGTVGNAIKIMLRYQELTSDRFTDQSSIEEGILSIWPVPRWQHISHLRNIAEDCLVGNWRIFEVLLGPDADLRGASAHFAFPEPGYSDTYYEVFKPCSVEFNAEKTELKVPEEWLALPVASANIVMSSVTAAVCERLLGPGPSNRMDTPRAVRRLLLSRPRKRMLRLEEAADELLMSTAQLRKRLYRAKTSYKSIVLETRMGLARHYLESTPLSIQEIAFLLDYSQAGPFSRAFKNYYGFSPRDARLAG